MLRIMAARHFAGSERGKGQLAKNAQPKAKPEAKGAGPKFG